MESTTLPEPTSSALDPSAPGSKGLKADAIGYLSNLVIQQRFQNGDLDFEGNSYVPDWPDGSPNHPTSANYIGPFTGGRTYPTVQFETDVGGSENLCDPATGVGCTAPPISAQFYPFWTLGSARGRQSLPTPHGLCVWNFGNDLPTTTQDFGRDAQYGSPNVERYGGTLTSPPLPNPQLSTRCGSRHYY
jgi:hypothetical protein